MKIGNKYDEKWVSLDKGKTKHPFHVMSHQGMRLEVECYDLIHNSGPIERGAEVAFYLDGAVKFARVVASDNDSILTVEEI